MSFHYTIAMSLAVTVFWGDAAIAASHGGELPPGVKARQAHMQLYAHNVGILGGMARERTEYEAKAASAAAANLAALSKLDQMTYWTPGTDSDSLVGTRALPAIWENTPDVLEKAAALTSAAEALAATAGQGLGAVQEGMGAVGGACRACHKAYQLPDDE